MNCLEYVLLDRGRCFKSEKLQLHLKIIHLVSAIRPFSSGIRNSSDSARFWASSSLSRCTELSKFGHLGLGRNVFEESIRRRYRQWECKLFYQCFFKKLHDKSLICRKIFNFPTIVFSSTFPYSCANIGLMRQWKQQLIFNFLMTKYGIFLSFSWNLFARAYPSTW